MGNARKKFEQKGFDEQEYQRYFHLHQSEYIRKKLRVLKLYHEKTRIGQISTELSVHIQSIHKYVNTYLSGGFKLLCQEIVRPQQSRLSQEQCQAFKNIILSKKPFEVGLEGNIWTGQIMREYIEKTYSIIYKSGIYDLLARLELSHQKAHADYGNADKEAQIKFLNELKDRILAADQDKIVIKFDEFSISEKPTSFYDWAEKNTRPKVVTNEKKAKEQTAS